MNKKEIFEHYSFIIDNLIKTDDFFKYFFQCPFYISDFNITDNRSLCFGVTRGCFVDRDFPYVVKFNLFNNTDGDFYNCCEKELDFYTSAAQDKLEEAFIEPIFIGTFKTSYQYYDNVTIEDTLGFCDYDLQEEYIGNLTQILEENELSTEEKQTIHISIPLYAYQVAEEICFDEVEEANEEVKRYSSPLNEYDSKISKKIIEDYGEDYYYRLTDFLYAYEIGDIHGGNVMSLCGKTVLSDYAGYFPD